MRALDVLSEAFLSNHPDEAARAIESLGERDAAHVLARVSVEAAAQAMSRVAPNDAGRLLAELGPERSAAILNRLEVQDAAAVLRTLEPAEQAPLLAALDEDDAQPISLLLMYPEGTAGAYMDPRALCVPADITVDQAQQRVRVRYQRSMYYVYVVDRDKELVGVVNLRELFIAPKGAPLASITRRTVARIKASARRNAIVTAAERVSPSVVTVSVVSTGRSCGGGGSSCALAAVAHTSHSSASRGAYRRGMVNVRSS